MLGAREELEYYGNSDCSFSAGRHSQLSGTASSFMIDAVKMGADVVGAIPHFEFTREYSVESLNFALQLAADNDKLVDVHCDEIDDEASRGLETVAAKST